MNRLRITDEVAELIRTMHPDLKKKVKTSLRTIMENPHSGKSLKEDLSGLWSFRVSRFRIIYKVVAMEIHVIAIGPRRSIYKETYRLLGKER